MSFFIISVLGEKFKIHCSYAEKCIVQFTWFLSKYSFWFSFSWKNINFWPHFDDSNKATTCMANTPYTHFLSISTYVLSTYQNIIAFHARSDGWLIQIRQYLEKQSSRNPPRLLFSRRQLLQQIQCKSPVKIRSERLFLHHHKRFLIKARTVYLFINSTKDTWAIK